MRKSLILDSASDVNANANMWPEIICRADGVPLFSLPGKVVGRCGHQWTVELDIPRMTSDVGDYSAAFGLQWKRYREQQLDSCTGTTISRDRARRCLGDECWRLLHRAERTDVLEVGCGAGRFTEVLLATGSYVTSVDLSCAVEANQQTCPQSNYHRVLQADALQLPFSDGQYDVVFCLGVIQHTPNPEETIKHLYAQVKPGGWLVIDHYTYRLSYFTKTTPLVRSILRRLSPEEGLKWTERLVTIFFPMHRAVRKSRIVQILLSRLSPVMVYYHAFPLSDDLQRQWALIDTHDSLTDWYKHFRTKRQIENVLRDLGMMDIYCEYGGNGVEARGRKPQV